MFPFSQLLFGFRLTNGIYVSFIVATDGMKASLMQSLSVKIAWQPVTVCHCKVWSLVFISQHLWNVSGVTFHIFRSPYRWPFAPLTQICCQTDWCMAEAFLVCSHITLAFLEPSHSRINIFHVHDAINQLLTQLMNFNGCHSMQAEKTDNNTLLFECELCHL